MKEALERAWTHVAWADARLGERLAEVEGRGGAEDARRLFAHLVASERVWLDRIAHGVSEHPVWPVEEVEVASLLRQAARNAEEVLELLSGLSEDGLDRPVRYRTTSGVPHETRLHDILLHVALHGSYHRGQVARSLREAGVEPVSTDYIVFVRETGSRRG